MLTCCGQKLKHQRRVLETQSFNQKGKIMTGVLPHAKKHRQDANVLKRWRRSCQQISYSGG
jgi:hypothetical protein